MTIGSERAAVQNPFIRYAVEAGWTYLTPDQALDLRRGITSPVLDAVLIDQLQRLNPGVVDHQRAESVRDRLIRLRPDIQGNLTAWEYLRGLKTVFVERENRERNIDLLARDCVEANRFHVTDEFTFSSGNPPNIRPDIVFFINGAPVIVCETKAARDTEGIAKAFDDIRYYHREGPELLALLQLYNLTHLIQFYYGATWSLTRKGLFNWRDEQAGDFETLVKTFVAPRRVLRVLTDFILFTRKDGELSKVVLRPHQMRAVERCVARARDEDKRRGLVWHTQGSGKTYTMLIVAERLIADPAFQNPTVLMLVDRNELEAQLFGNLEAAGFGNVAVARSKRHLRQLLREDRRGLIVSMIHKFDDIPANLNTRDNIFVLVDEAHRTTGGDLGNYLMGALPNATYLGFTGTPIDQTAYGKGTFKVFGTDDPRGYLDKYSIRESVEDGATVPLHYQLAPNDLLVDRETLNREFLDLAEAEGVSDFEELDRILERAVTLRNMLKNESRVDLVARFVADHFTNHVEPMHYKAFLVAVDREACALYKEALDRYLPKEEYSAVVISTQGKRDPALIRQFALSAEKEKELRKEFRKPEGLPKIFIVTEKLLTGFDAPILYCMYLDKPMRDHVLLQAIARVNRPHEDDEGRRKPSGFVLDFVGIFDKLEKALAFDSKDVEGVVEGIDVLKNRFVALMDRARREYLPIAVGASADKVAEAILEHFRDREPREEFYAFFRELQEVYEIISPDAFLRPFLDDYTRLVDMYHLLRSSYDRGITVDKAFLRKTEQLVRDHSKTHNIRELGPIYEITPDSLVTIAQRDEPDTVKIFNLLVAIDQLVRAYAAREPYMIDIGEKAEQIAKAFEERQKTTQETLQDLLNLAQETDEARREREKSDLSPDAFAVEWFLKGRDIPAAKTVARAAHDAFRAHPHWQSSAHQKRDVLRALVGALVRANASNEAALAEHILKMLEEVPR